MGKDYVFLALWLAQLKFFLVYTMVLFLQLQRREMPMKICKCLRCCFKLLIGYKYSADVFGISLSGMISTETVLLLPIGVDVLTTYSFAIIMGVVFLSSIAVTIFMLTSCIRFCRANKEMKILLNKLFYQLSPFLGYPVMFLFSILLLTLELKHIDGLCLFSWISFAVTASIWCCANNIILTIHVTIILCTRRKEAPRIAVSETGERSPLNHSTTDNVRSSTYFSIPVED